MAFEVATFFKLARGGIMGPTLDQGEVNGCTVILGAFADQPLAYAAYALATAWHETAHTMMPVKERGGAAYFFRMYDIEGQRPHVARRLGNTQPGDGVKFAGRGYPQTTGRANYKWASDLTGVDLIGKPDDMMEPDIAATVMFHGMIRGKFTGKKLADYLPAKGPATSDQFKAARRIINGTDRAADIAAYAVALQDYLSKAGWGQ